MGRLIRCITSDGCVTAMAIDTTDIVNEAVRLHETSAVVSAALGRLLTAASMMGSALKSSVGSVTLRVSGDGPIGSVVAVSDSNGNVRGYVGNNVVEIPLNPKGKLDVGGAIGEGNLYVLKDLGMKEPYNGVIPLVSGEIAEDITAYFAESEQIPTVCALGVLVNPDLSVKAAGGYIIQLLPTADDEIIDKVEKSIEKIQPITTLLSNGMSLEDIVKTTLNLFDVEVLDESNVEYKCTCSYERTKKVLMTLGADDLEKLASESEVTSVNCHFCNSVYEFTSSEIKELIKK